MQKQVTVRVPATSANCGPGFDCLGLALTLHNEFTYRISDESFGFSLTVEGEGKDRFHASGRNMAFASFLHLWNKADEPETDRHYVVDAESGASEPGSGQQFYGHRGRDHGGRYVERRRLIR